MDGTQVIQIKPFVSRTSHGDVTYGPPVTVRDVIVWPRTSEELERGGTIIDGQNVYIQPGKPIPNAKDQIVYDGKTYDIDGVPGEYPLGGEFHTLVVLKGTGS